MAPSTAGSRGKRADAEFRLPADGAYVSVLRTAIAAIAARLDLTIDDIEDLRVAVGEAGALLLPEADEAADLHCRCYLRPGRLVVTIGVDSRHPSTPDRESFAWQVLTTLTDLTEVEYADGHLAITMSLTSSALGSPGAARGAGLDV